MRDQSKDTQGRDRGKMTKEEIEGEERMGKELRE